MRRPDERYITMGPNLHDTQDDWTVSFPSSQEAAQFADAANADLETGLAEQEYVISLRWLAGLMIVVAFLAFALGWVLG